MTYDLPDYFRATNLAYEVLLKSNQLKLPVMILPLIKATPSMIATTYSEFAKRSGLDFEEFIKSCPSDYGFVLNQGNRYIIVANEKLPFEVYRFTLAHEFGHCILGHTEDNPSSRKEANCFARNLLCPHPVRSGLMLNTPGEYSKIFVVSNEMATVTINLQEHDRYHIIRDLANNVSMNFSEYFSLNQGGTHEFV